MNMQLKIIFLKFIFTFFIGSLMAEDELKLNSNEVFIIRVKRTDFDKQIGKNDKLSITATMNGMPDLPDNVYFIQEPNKDALLFGVVDDDVDYEFELIAKHLTTYEIYKHVIKLKFTPKDKEPKNHIELKVNNLNVEDMLTAKDELIRIFREALWTDADDLFMTMIALPLDVGGRAPLNPKSKSGVVNRVKAISPMIFCCWIEKLCPLKIAYHARTLTNHRWSMCSRNKTFRSIGVDFV